MSRDAPDDEYPVRVKGRGEKAQKASGDVCVLYDITVTLKIKISQIIGLERGWDRRKQIAEARERDVDRERASAQIYILPLSKGADSFEPLDVVHVKQLELLMETTLNSKNKPAC